MDLGVYSLFFFLSFFFLLSLDKVMFGHSGEDK